MAELPSLKAEAEALAGYPATKAAGGEAVPVQLLGCPSTWTWYESTIRICTWLEASAPGASSPASPGAASPPHSPQPRPAWRQGGSWPASSKRLADLGAGRLAEQTSARPQRPLFGAGPFCKGWPGVGAAGSVGSASFELSAGAWWFPSGRFFKAFKGFPFASTALAWVSGCWLSSSWTRVPAPSWLWPSTCRKLLVWRLAWPLLWRPASASLRAPAPEAEDHQQAVSSRQPTSARTGLLGGQWPQTRRQRSVQLQLLSKPARPPWQLRLTTATNKRLESWCGNMCKMNSRNSRADIAFWGSDNAENTDFHAKSFRRSSCQIFAGKVQDTLLIATEQTLYTSLRLIAAIHPKHLEGAACWISANTSLHLPSWPSCQGPKAGQQQSSNQGL